MVDLLASAAYAHSLQLPPHGVAVLVAQAGYRARNGAVE
jgi:hypothetical protein